MVEIIFLLQNILVYVRYMYAFTAFLYTVSCSLCVHEMWVYACLLRVNYRWCICVRVCVPRFRSRHYGRFHFLSGLFHNRCFFFQLALYHSSAPLESDTTERADENIREYKYAVRVSFDSLRSFSFRFFPFLQYVLCTPEYLQLKCVYVYTHTRFAAALIALNWTCS